MTKEQHIEAAAKEYGYEDFKETLKRGSDEEIIEIVSKAMDSWADAKVIEYKFESLRNTGLDKPLDHKIIL